MERQVRHQLNGRKFYPVQIQNKETASVAYLYNMSLDGFCIALPKRSGKDFLNDLVLESESLFLSNKLHVSILDVNESIQVTEGDILDVKMAPFRMDKINCQFQVLHSREDENYIYYGGKTVYSDNETRAKVEAELAGVSKRHEGPNRKKTSVTGALWFSGAVATFAYVVNFLTT